MKRSIGKENKLLQGNNNRGGGGVRHLDYSSPKGNNVLKTTHSCPNTCKLSLNSGFQQKGLRFLQKGTVLAAKSGPGGRNAYGEHDVSIDSRFKEKLRKLMGTKEVKVPVMFMKGRLVGGAKQVVKLEEEEKLTLPFEGIPTAVGAGGCEGCGGVRLLMCVACNGRVIIIK
ncbi:hypothetical protein PIB30_044852 [Stylosanthes scabra]|uniref:Glutaredoxin domain-containing protein n=1 Tax=Stylosanthes scabra TaxID=79078 RepID=A0ABU6ZER1_9FABA|nr:hypothetical protein [Stylosanthes scabra]